MYQRVSRFVTPFKNGQAQKQKGSRWPVGIFIYSKSKYQPYALGSGAILAVEPFLIRYRISYNALSFRGGFKAF